jgi:hypothetical protein
MNPPLAALDRAISYLKNLIVHCDGNIIYHLGRAARLGRAPAIHSFAPMGRPART